MIFWGNYDLFCVGNNLQRITRHLLRKLPHLYCYVIFFH